MGRSLSFGMANGFLFCGLPVWKEIVIFAVRDSISADVASQKWHFCIAKAALLLVLSTEMR